ncbi:glycosyl transferase family protein [Klebsiella oxytoca]|nr:glycosyl transferase family protein [Klebsiella oxytoca]HEO8931532.1 glycosyltransferase family 4 protein [Serratia marcescens]HEP0989376.1 glycosyltransferase family 4 protein [Serratia marcescens]
MKIIIINTLYFPHHVGGAEFSVQILAETLAAVGHQVKVITLHNEDKRRITVINGVEVVYLPLRNIYWPFEPMKRSKLARFFWHLMDNYNRRAAKDVGKELDYFQPDIVHTNNISGFSVSVWSAAAMRNIRIIHTARDYYLFHPNTTLYNNGVNQTVRSLSVFAWSALKKHHSKKVSSFVGISRFIMDFHSGSGFFPKAHRTHIYNPVSVPLLRSGFRGDRRVGFIGRLNEAKGFDSFCFAVGAIRERLPEITAVAAGGFSVGKESELRGLAERFNVELLGKISLSDFLQCVDIVVLPIKWREPFGRVVIECALAGKIVLARPVGGIKELMEITPNVLDLDSHSIIDLIMEERIVCRDIPARVRALFSPEAIAEEYILEYERVKLGN